MISPGESHTVKECLQDYAERFAGRNHVAQRQCLADFTGNSYHGAVLYWLNGTREPIGLSFWKVTVFFHLIGYRVKEFESLRPEYQIPVILMAVGVMGPEEVAEKFGYENKDPTSQLFHTLKNNTLLNDQKMSTIQAFAGEYGKMVEEIRNDTVVKYQAVLLPPKVPAEEPEVDDSSKTEVTESGEEAQSPNMNGADPAVVIESLAHLIRAAIPLATFLESDQATEVMRAKLRDLSGKDADGVFRLGNLLNRLCGERARRSLRNNGENS